MPRVVREDGVSAIVGLRGRKPQQLLNRSAGRSTRHQRGFCAPQPMTSRSAWRPVPEPRRPEAQPALPCAAPPAMEMSLSWFDGACRTLGPLGPDARAVHGHRLSPAPTQAGWSDLTPFGTVAHPRVRPAAEPAGRQTSRSTPVAW
jgi:hypothetical protein